MDKFNIVVCLCMMSLELVFDGSCMLMILRNLLCNVDLLVALTFFKKIISVCDVNCVIFSCLLCNVLRIYLCNIVNKFELMVKV